MDRDAEPVATTTTTLVARALLVGRHIELRRLGHIEPVATNPVLIPVGGGGWAVLHRSGAVVLFGVPPMEEAAFLEHLSPFVRGSVETPETEQLTIRIDPQRSDGMDRDRLVLADTDPARLQVIADILGKSVLLAEQEARVARTFDRVEPLAEELQRRGRGVHRAGALVRHIGETLLIQHRMVGRGEVGDRPEVLWERPELGRLFQNLEDEYEIRDRQLALDRKLELIGNTASTLLDLLQSRRSLRVEWYIVILIVAEIALTVYQLLLHGGKAGVG
jgi:required for meiotic nuclear division protein 1